MALTTSADQLDEEYEDDRRKPRSYRRSLEDEEGEGEGEGDVDDSRVAKKDKRSKTRAIGEG